MKAENRRDRHVDVLEVISCGGSPDGESRAALEMFLLQTRPTLAPEPTAGDQLNGLRIGVNEAGGRPHP